MNVHTRMPEVPQFSALQEIELPDISNLNLPLVPERWLMIVTPVGIKKKSKGGILIPEQAQDDQYWTSGLGMVVAHGPAVYRGRQFADKGLSPEDAPPVGSLVVYNAKTPLRVKVDDLVLIYINDDATLARVPDASQAHRIVFTFA